MIGPRVCQHCGYFIDWELPKAPATPGWVHTLSRPDKPINNDGPCDRPEPTAAVIARAFDVPSVMLGLPDDGRRPGPGPSLPEFLLARIAEDEAAVNERTQHLAPSGWSYWEQFGDFGDDERWMIEIPAARVLAECAAKRAIVEAYREERNRRDAYQSEDARAGEDAEQALRRRTCAARCRGLEIAVEALAQPYAEHPDYREEWRA